MVIFSYVCLGLFFVSHSSSLLPYPPPPPPPHSPSLVSSRPPSPLSLLPGLSPTRLSLSIHNTTLLPNVNTLIARGMFCGAKYTHHTFIPLHPPPPPLFFPPSSLSLPVSSSLSPPLPLLTPRPFLLFSLPPRPFLSPRPFLLLSFHPFPPSLSPPSPLSLSPPHRPFLVPPLSVFSCSTALVAGCMPIMCNRVMYVCVDLALWARYVLCGNSHL